MQSLAEDRQSRSSRWSGRTPDLRVRHALPRPRLEKRVQQQPDRVEARRPRSDSRPSARRALRSAWYSVVCVRFLVAAGTFEFPEFVAQKLRAVRDQREHPVALLTCGDDFFLRSRHRRKTQKSPGRYFVPCSVRLISLGEKGSNGRDDEPDKKCASTLDRSALVGGCFGSHPSLRMESLEFER